MSDARALWVNPAGLGVVALASVHLDLNVTDPGAKGRLRQVTAGFSSRGWSFGYQRDLFDGGVRGHTYRMGLGAGRGGLSAGLAATLYRGDTKGTGFDFGTIYQNGPIAVGGAVANLGQPVVRGIVQKAGVVAGVTARPFGSVVALSAQGRITTDSVLGYGLGARIQTSGRLSVGLLARFETDRSFRRTAFALGVSLGAQDVVGALLSTPGDLSRIAAVDLYGVSSRTGRR